MDLRFVIMRILNNYETTEVSVYYRNGFLGKNQGGKTSAPADAVAFSFGKQGGWQMAVNGIGNNSPYPVQTDYLVDAKKENNQSAISQNYVHKEGVCYEKTIPDSVSLGPEYMQGLEKQLSGTKFFVGTVSYGQTYGNSSDVNFVINPKYLGKLGTDEATRKQFEEDVKFLNDFSKRFRQHELANGREIISQGWFCDENGNWGGWTISRPTKQSSVLQDMADNAEKIRQEKLEERKKAEEELKEHFGDRFKGLNIKWLEGEKSEETSEAAENKEVSEEESETISGKVGVNVGKTARKIAAAKTKTQLRAVMAEIAGDMQEVKAGIEKGWCDESEMEKVNSLMAQAQNRMGQVDDREATPEEENMFAMASLM